MSYGRALKVLDFYKSTADARGYFDINGAVVAERFGIKQNSVGELVRRLCNSGAVVRVALGQYRVTGVPHITKKPATFVRTIKAPPLAMEGDEPTYRGGAPCSYHTARECGIEPVVRMVANRASFNSTSSTQPIAVTLARIPCLERPLPREAA